MIMSMELMVLQCHTPRMPSPLLSTHNHNIQTHRLERLRRRPTMVMVSHLRSRNSSRRSSSTSRTAAAAAAVGEGLPLPPLDMTEDNIRLVLADARVELAQLFDTSVGITGEIALAELDGPFVKISLKGRFWHKRSTVVARVGNYLKQRIPEILEVDIEDEKQLDDSPENF